MNKIDRIEKYLFEFFQSRWEDFEMFYRSVRAERHSGIYQLKDGDELLNFLDSIHGNIQDQYFYKKLIPQQFTTPDALFRSLRIFKKYLLEKRYLIDQNYNDELTSHIIHTINKMQLELIEMIDYAVQLYDFEDTRIPYLDLRQYLITQKPELFIVTLKSILASVSYAIVRVYEGFFHSNVHLILKLLGFYIISEEQTNVGRIDAVIRFSQIIYILEFKFGTGDDNSSTALQQIRDNKYAEKFYVEGKQIIGIGISFDTESRNINGFVSEQLNA